MFKGLGNLGNIGSMVGALQSLPQKLEELNVRMKAESVSGCSSCGRVTVTMNGVGEVASVQIDPELAGEELSTAVKEASNSAGAAAKELFASAIRDMTAEMDLNLPGMENIIGAMTGR